MAKKYSFPLVTRLLFLLVVALAFVIIILVYKKYTQPVAKKAVSLQNTPEYSLLVNAAVWYPSAPWSKPALDTQVTSYGKLQGESIHAQITSNKSYLDHYEDTNALKTQGFLLDNSLLADRAGASLWGYLKTDGKTKQVILFMYETQPTSNNPNKPLQFTCPCKINTTVFVSKSW